MRSSIRYRRQVRHDLAHDAGELEPVSQETRRDVDVVGFRMRVQDKVLVRTIGEHAGLHRQGWAVGIRKIPADPLAEHVFIFGMNLAIDASRVHILATVVIFSDFESRNSVHRASVEAALGSFEIEDRERSELKKLGT